MPNWEKEASRIVEEMAQIINVGFKRLNDDAIIPTKAHATDSGFDLYAAEDVIIEPGETVIVPTGVAVQLPEGYEAQVRPRSGVTAKTKLRVQLGTIDNEYTGEIGVIVDNIAQVKYDLHSDDPRIVRSLGRNREKMTDVASTLDDWLTQVEITGDRFNVGTIHVEKGDRLAQLVVQSLPAVEAYEIEGEIGDSERGGNGFGSSGV